MSPCHSGFAMPVKLGARPTELSLQRFPRALKLLGLKVFVGSTQTDPGANSSDVEVDSKTSGMENVEVESSDGSDAGDELAACWPQLTVLTRYLSKREDV